MPYINPRANSMAQLMLQRGQSAADAERRSGEVWGNTVANVGQQFGRTMSDLMRQREDAPRRAVDDALLREKSHELRGAQILRELGTRLADPQTGNVDAIAMAKELRTAGHADLAARVEATHRQEQDKALDAMLQRVSAHKTAFGQGTQLLRELETQPTLYPQIRPKLIELASAIDPELGANIPEAYEPTTVKGMMDFTLAAVKQAETRERALVKLKAANAATDDQLKRTKLHRESLADWLSTATSQQDWDISIQHAKGLGIDASVIAEFGDWSEDAPARANAVLMTPTQRADAAKGPTAGSKEDIYASYAAEFLKRPARTMTATEKTRAEKWWNERTKVESGSEGGGVTPAAKATAERWKFNQLKALEEVFAASREGEADVAGLSPEAQAIVAAMRGGSSKRGPMSTEELNRQKLEIENGYRRQIGVPPVTALPPGWGVTPQAEPPPPPPKPQAAAAAAGPVRIQLPDGRSATFKDQAAADAFQRELRALAGR